MSQREMTRPYILPDGNTNSSYEVLLPKEKKKSDEFYQFTTGNSGDRTC